MLSVLKSHVSFPRLTLGHEAPSWPWAARAYAQQELRHIKWLGAVGVRLRIRSLNTTKRAPPQPREGACAISGPPLTFWLSIRAALGTCCFCFHPTAAYFRR